MNLQKLKFISSGALEIKEHSLQYLGKQDEFDCYKISYPIYRNTTLIGYYGSILKFKPESFHQHSLDSRFITTELHLNSIKSDTEEIINKLNFHAEQANSLNWCKSCQRPYRYKLCTCGNNNNPITQSILNLFNQLPDNYKSFFK